MRLATRTMATFVAALAAGTAAAQAPQPSTPPGGEAESRTRTLDFRPETTAGSRFVRERTGTPKPVAGIKNYHDELFGGEPPAAGATSPGAGTPPTAPVDPARPAAAPQATTAAQPAPRPSAPTSDAAAPAMAQPAEPRVTELPAMRRDPAVRKVDFREFDPANFGGAGIADQPIGGAAPSRVVNAEFEQNPDDPAERVQTVAGETPPAAAAATPSIPSIAPIVGGPEAAAVGPQSPALTLEWVKKTDVNVGQECVLDLTVANSGAVTAYDVLVEAYLPPSIRVVSTEPKAAENRDSLSWSFPRIGTDESKTIRVTIVPTERGELATRAHVRFTGAAATLFQVEEPLIEIAVRGPNEVHLGEPASQIVTVSNPGTGIARNVVLEARLPEGLEHPRGTKLVTEIGTLNPNESRQVRLTLAATAGGNQVVLVAARADGNLEQTAQAQVTVVAPSLDVAIDGPKLRYLGRAADYQLVVANDGTAPTDNVRVVHQVPEGFEFVSADNGGKYSSTSRQIAWFVGRIEPGRQLALGARLEPKTTGAHEHRVGAISEQGARGEATLVTNVDSAAELTLEIVDTNDPVEVGVETSYEIRIRNDGSKAANGVGISCELPAAVEFVDARGPSAHVAEGGIVVYKSLDSLPPGKTAVYIITVKGTTEGNHRVRARLASESITEPLIIEELTKFYGE